MQEAWKLVSNLEIISITILLLKCLKQMQPQEQAISFSLDEMSSHTFMYVHTSCITKSVLPETILSYCEKKDDLLYIFTKTLLFCGQGQKILSGDST